MSITSSLDTSTPEATETAGRPGPIEGAPRHPGLQRGARGFVEWLWRPQLRSRRHLTFGPQGTQITVSYPSGAMLVGVIGIFLAAVALCRWVAIASFFGSGELLAPFFAQVDAPADQVELMLSAVCLLITSVFLGLYLAAAIITLRRLWGWFNAPVLCPVALVGAFERTTHNIAVARVHHRQRSELVQECNRVLGTVNAVRLASHDDALLAEATTTLAAIDQQCADLTTEFDAERDAESDTQTGHEVKASTASRKTKGTAVARQWAPAGVGPGTNSVTTSTTSTVDAQFSHEEKQ